MQPRYMDPLSSPTARPKYRYLPEMVVNVESQWGGAQQQQIQNLTGMDRRWIVDFRVRGSHQIRRSFVVPGNCLEIEEPGRYLRPDSKESPFRSSVFSSTTAAFMRKEKNKEKTNLSCNRGPVAGHTTQSSDSVARPSPDGHASNKWDRNGVGDPILLDNRVMEKGWDFMRNA